MMGQQDKIIQITPAPGNLWAETRDDNGNHHDLRAVCLALMESGRVVPLVVVSGDFCRGESPYIKKGPRHPY